MARKLKTIAKEIRALFPDLIVTLTPWVESTDRKIGRLRWPGKGRKGFLLTVAKRRKGKPFPEVIFSHNSAETYRTNQEVEDWWERFTRAHFGTSQERRTNRCSSCPKSCGVCDVHGHCPDHCRG